MPMAAAVAKKSGGMLRIKPVALELGISSKSVIKLIDNGSLRAIDVSAGQHRSDRRRTLRIAAEELKRFLGAHSTHKPRNDDT